MNVTSRLATLVTIAGLASGCAGTGLPPSPASPTATPATSSARSSSTPTSMAPVQEPSHEAARWDGAGTMIWPRRDPTAVVLGDGRVLVLGDTGGKYEAVPEDSRFAELWDPTTGTWSETDFLPKARGSFAAVALQDGRALVAGGVNDTWFSYSSAYVFDPATERWTKVGLMGTARADPAVAVLADGRVLVAGGMYYTGLAQFEATAGDAILASSIQLADSWPGPAGYALATAELFDPASGTWSPTGPMHYARDTASAVTLADGRVLVTGAISGERVDERARGTTEIYDPSSGRFSLAEDLPTAVDQALLDQLGVPASDRCEWATIDDVGPLVALGDGDAYLPGSHWSCTPSGAADAPSVSLTRTFRFTAATGRWSEAGLTNVHSWRETTDGESVQQDWGQDHPDGIVVPMRDGGILVAGGFGSDGLGIRTAELLDPATGAWSPLPDMPGARAAAAGAALADGSVLIVGGWSNPGDGWPIALGDTFRFIPGS